MTIEHLSGSEISVQSISKGYLDRDGYQLVLDDISFDVSRGEVLAICGLSGVGKSTLLRLIAGLVELTQGQILVNGEQVTSPPEKMGFVTQDFSRSLLPWLNVEDNVALPLRGRKIEKVERAKRSDEVLSAVGLADVASYYPWQLSGGMQQRVALARAIIVRPNLLLLDEPFASVDAHIRLELEDLVASLVQDFKITTILVTHDVDEAIYLADRVLVLSSSPARIKMQLQVDLSRPRDQLVTRSSNQFITLRRELYLSLR